MLAAGLLRDEITIESRDATVTASGTPNGGWTTFASIRASVIEMEGKETFEGEQSVARQTHEVRIRYMAGITRDMRVVWGDRVLQIHGFGADSRRREITMRCEERVS